MKEYITPEIYTLKPTAKDIITSSVTFGAAADGIVGDVQYDSLHDYFQ